MQQHDYHIFGEPPAKEKRKKERTMQKNKFFSERGGKGRGQRPSLFAF